MKRKPITILSVVGLLLTSIIIVGAGYVLYSRTKHILTEKLKERLVGIVSTASIQFDPTDFEEILEKEDTQKQVYKNLVANLQQIRNQNPNVYYVYVLRPTEDPDTFEFIADADSMDPDAEVDLDKNGIIDDADALNSPGEEYDVSEIPNLRNQALLSPTTDEEPEGDQWGLFLSAYAPIKSRGETVGILGIDVEVSDFQNLISSTRVPFVFFVVFIISLLVVLTLTLIQLWSARLKFLAELDRQKDELLGLVSHQLAAPVSAIKWYIEMLLDGDLGELKPEQKQQLETVQLSTGNLSDLIGMILDVSRIQLGRIRIDKQELDLNVFFKEILDVVTPKAIEKKIDFQKNMPATLPMAMLDKRYTRMTIENMLTNAIKYTPNEGKVHINVTITDNVMRVMVKDTGCGIPVADQKNIFGKMYRASNVRNSSIDGNGFGLYIAKSAVESQGGKMWFESQENKGTTFYVTLPLQDQSPQK